MTKRVYFSLILIIFLYSLFALAEENEFLTYIDYDGANANLIHGIGIQQGSQGYQLKYWQDGGQAFEEIITTSSDQIFNSKIAVDSSSRKVIAYVREDEGKFYLHLIKNTNGNWITVNSGAQINTNLKELEIVKLILNDEFAYVAYLQENMLHLLQYSFENNLVAEMYQKSMSDNKFVGLTLVQQNLDVVIAYSEQMQDQVHGQEKMHLVRIKNGGQSSEIYSVDQVNGYDLKVLGSKVYLAYEQRVNQSSQIYLLEESQGSVQETAVISRQDQSPSGIKLLVADGELKLLYRETGLNQQFDLFLSRYQNGEFIKPEYIDVENLDYLLYNLRENVKEIDSTTLLLTSSEWNQVGEKNTQRYQLVSLVQRVPYELWVKGMSQDGIHSVPLKVPEYKNIHNVNLKNPTGVVMDDNHNVYFLDSIGLIRKFDLSGGFIDRWDLSNGKTVKLADLVMDSEGYFYVVDSLNHHILRLDSDGKIVEIWGKSGSNPGQFFQPVAIAIDQDGNIYVSDQGNHRIQKFDAQHNFVTQWGGLGSNSGELDHPAGITIDSQNRIYIADSGNHRVQVYHSDGTLINQMGTWGMNGGEMIDPVDVAVKQDQLYIADRGNHRIQVFNLNLNYLYELGSWGGNWGEFKEINNLYLDQDGNLYVTDKINHMAQKVASDHTVLQGWHGGEELILENLLEAVGIVGQSFYFWSVKNQTLLQYDVNLKLMGRVTLKGQENRIFSGFTVDRTYFYFTDTLNNTVVVYDHQGGFIKEIGGFGSGPGQFDQPQGIAVDQEGYIYIADTGNHRVQKLNSKGEFVLKWGNFGLDNGDFIDPISITYQNSRLLVVDLGLSRIQAFTMDGSYQNSWNGLGSDKDQLSFEDYLQNDLVDSGQNQRLSSLSPSPLFLGYDFGILNDDIPKRSKTWQWNDKWGYSYRSEINQQSYYIPTTIYQSDHLTNSISGVTGKYYLHVQAKWTIFTIGSGHFYAILDNEKPILTMPKSDLTPQRSVTLSWQGSDLDVPENEIAYKYKISNTHPDQWSAAETNEWETVLPFTSTTSLIADEGNGTKYLVVQAKDRAGNQSDKYVSTFVMDHQAPAISRPQKGLTEDNRLRITFYGQDNVSSEDKLKYRCVVDKNPNTEPTGSYKEQNVAITDYMLGTVYVHVQVQDEAGNTSAPVHYTFNLADIIPPTITGLSNQSNPVKKWTWNWDGTDNKFSSNEISYRFKSAQRKYTTLDDLPFGSDRQYTVENVPDGTYYLSIQAKDGAGNQTAVQHYSVILDTTSPTLDQSQIIYSGNLVNADQKLYSSAVTIKIPSSAYKDVNGVDKIEYKIDAGSYQTYNQSFKVEADGSHEITIRLTDKAGNSSTFTLESLKIDTTPPELIQPDVTTMEHTWFNSAQKVMISVTDYYSGLASLEYNLNGSGWQSLINGEDVQVSAEKENTLQVRMIDRAGNEQIVEIPVKIDLTLPSIASITFGTYEVGTWTDQRNGDFEIRNHSDLSGVRQYYYQINSEPNYNPYQRNDYQITSSNKIQVSNLANGIHYLHIHPVDSAGNVGAVVHYQIMVVDETPEKPVIQSDTHSQNAGSLYQKAHFFWNTPIAGKESVVGIIHYEYTLDKVINGESELVEAGTTLLNEKTFADLPVLSIGTGSFYRFGLVAVNGVGKKSPKATFTFNVEDINQAGMICIFSDTHPNVVKYYNNLNPNFFWWYPGSTAGVDFYYRFGPEEGFNQMVWHSVAEQKKSFSITNPTSNTYSFQVKGVNGSNIKTSYTQKFKLDLEKPEISSFQINLDTVLNQATVNWGKASDTGGASLAEVKLRLYVEDDNGTIILDRGWMSCDISSGQKTIQHLQPDIDYTLEFEVWDQAGNRRLRAARFNLLTDVDYFIGESINRNLDNWQVEGKSYDGNVQKANIIISNVYQFQIFDETNGYQLVEKIPLTDGTLIGDYGFEGFNNDIQYKVNLSGRIFKGQGVYINSSGFHLKKIWMEVPEDFWYDDLGQEVTENKHVIFVDVDISALAGNQVEGSFSNRKDNCSYYDTWLYDIDQFILDADSLDFSGTVDLISAYVDTPLQIHVILNDNFEFASIILPDDYELHLPGGSTLTVKESELSSEYLTIQRAEFTINVDGHVITTELGNFTIDPYGTIEHMDNYYSQKMTFTYGGVTYDIEENGIGFDDNTLYIMEGTGTVPGSTEKLPVADVPIDNQGDVLLPSEKYFTSIQKDVLGFSIKGLRGTQIGDYIVFEKGTIDLPITDGFEKPVTLELRNLAYGATGFDLSQVTIYTPYFNYNQLGTIEIMSLAFNQTGLTVNGKVQLGSNMPQGLRYRTLTLQPFTMTSADGITSNLVANVPTGEPLTIYDTLQFSTKQLNFRDDPDVKSIYFDQGSLQMIGEVGKRINTPAVDVNFVEIDHRGDLRQFDTDLSTQPFSLRGVDVTAYSLDVDPDYIHFIGKVNIPNLSDLEMPIYSFVMNHETGTIEEFYISGDAPLAYDFFSWDMEIYSIKIMEDSFAVKAALKIPEALKDFLSGISGRFMEIDELVIENSGTIEKLDLMIPYRDEISIGGGMTLIVKDPGVLIENAPMSNFNFGLSFAKAGLILPEELGGGILTVDNFSFDSNGNFAYDQIQLQDQTIPCFGVATINVSDATFNHSEVSIDGTVRLGDSFPGSFAGKVFTIDDLIIDGNGIRTFTVATDVSQPLNLFDAVQLSAEKISISEREITLTGGQVQFIGELAKKTTSTPVQLTTFRYDYKTGKVIEFTARFTDINFNLFGSAVDVSTLEFNTDYIAIEGSVKLPSSMPGALSGKSVKIDTLEIYYTGGVKDYRVEMDDSFKFNLNGLAITFDEMVIDSTGFTMDAIATLPDSSVIPSSLRNTRVAINGFKINNKFQVVDFTVSINKTASFWIGQTCLDINRLTFTKDKFSLRGAVVLPASYPGTLANQRIDFNQLEMNYQGRIIYSDISIAKIDFKLGNFLDARISNLAFVAKNGTLTASASQVVVRLGDSLGKDITFDQVDIDTNGNFSAHVCLNLDLHVAGTTLRITNPTLDSGGVHVASASLRLPSQLGGNAIAVNNVLIHPDRGLTIGGGSFKIKFPDIKIGDVGFKDTYMSLSVIGTEYYFQGNGSAQVPGIGKFDATVKLRNKSANFPRGIENISLSFQSSGLGLPLGTTGLYINGVRGEFADGPIPADSSTVVRRLGNGMRFKLGVYIRDLSGALTGSTDFWVNIENGNSAVVGRVALLNRLVTTDVSASIVKHFTDFYAEANIYITAVEGHAGFRVWAANRKTNLAGWANIRVSLTRGQVFYTKWRYWWWGWHTAEIAIPSRTWKSGYVGVEFGKFKNGAKGVKGYVDVPFFGKVGFFAGSPSFKIGGLRNYVLMGRPNALFKSLNYNPAKMSLMSTLNSQEPGNYSVGETEYVGFVLPGEKKQTLNQMKKMSTLSAEPMDLRDYYVESTQRLVFVVGFDVGDPEIVAISPNGNRFGKNTPGVEYVKEANQVMISIANPDPGIWYLELQEIRGVNYHVAILGSTPQPELNIDKPVMNQEQKLVISGRGGVFTGEPCYVDLYLDTDDQNGDGQLIAERLPLTDNRFSYEWEMADLPTGDYYIYGKLYDDGDMPPIVTYAENSVPVINYQPIMPPTQVKAVMVDDEIDVNWQISENPNVAGYKIYYGTMSGNYESVLDVGYLSKATLPLMEGEECYLTVVSYNDEKAESSYSTEVVVQLTEQEITEFNLADVKLPEMIQLYIGEGKTIQIPYTVDGFAAGHDGDYFTVELVDMPKGVFASLDQPFYNLYAEEQEITLSLLTEEEDVPVPGEEAMIMLAKAESGQCVARMVFTSVGNPELKVEKELNLVLGYRQPVLREVTPKEGINNLDREITLRGDYFREGVQVYLGENLIEVTSVEKHEIRGMVPQGVGPGLYDVKVVNDDKQLAELAEAYTVLIPEFTLEMLQAQVVVPLGAESEVYLKVEGFNEFANQVIVQPGIIPDGLWVEQEVQTIDPGEETSFLISAGYNLIPGKYQMTFTGMSGKLIRTVKVTVQVVDEDIAPEIHGFNKPFGITSEPIRLYGMGFGYSGNLYLNDKLVPVIEWRTNRIEFVIPEDATTGMITVEAGGQLSKPVELFVKEKKYSVSLNPMRILVNHGEDEKLRFVITGFSDPIDFTLENVPVGIGYRFLNDPTNVEPNYTLECQLTTTKGMKLGEYQIDLVGRIGDQIKRSTFTVVVADLPELQNREFAEGRVGVPYQDRIDVEGGFAPYKFQILNNSLPGGLRLAEDGSISGVPDEAGTYPVTVKVIDGSNQVAQQEIELKIMTNEWIYPEYDAMGTNRTNDRGPAAEDVGYQAWINGQPQMMLSSEEAILLIENEVVNLYDKANGSLIADFTTADAIVDAVVLKDGVVVLGQTGNLEMYRFGDGDSKDSNSDQILTNLNTQGHLYLYRDRIVVFGESLVEFRDKNGLTVDETIRLSSSYNPGVRGVLNGDILYYVTGQQQVVGFDLEEKITRFTTTFTDVITDLIGVEDGVMVVGQNGEVERLLADGSTKFVLRSSGIRDLIPYQDGYVVGNGTEISLFGLHGSPTNTIELDYNQLIVVGNRLYVTTEGAIQSYKLSNLNQVWTYKVTNGQNLVVSEEKLYAVADSTLCKFDAATNVYAPVSSAVTKPEAPEGENGYFKKDVILDIDSIDQDSEVMVTYYSVNGSEFEVYDGGILLSEGNHKVQFYAMDEELKLEDVKEAIVKVDYTPPVITLNTDPIDGLNGYYTTSVVNVSMEAVDVVSGVATLYYQIDDGEEQVYTAPFIVEGDGRHVIKYHGRDQAGNETDEMTHEILIDTTVPQLSFSAEEIDGLNDYYVHAPVQLIVNGDDNFSGLDKIYYQIDDQGYQAYDGMINVSGDSDHLVEYYGMDYAGNKTDVFEYQLKIDTTEPDVTLTADLVDGENGYYIQDPVNVWLTATDNFSGVDQIYFRVDGGEYHLYVDGIVVSGEADHLIEYYVVDLAGNETAVMQHGVKIDHTAPELTFTPAIVDGKNGYYVTIPVVHTLNGTDNLSGVDQLYYQIDDGEYQVYVDGIRISSDGAHVVHYYGEDRAGNETDVFEYQMKIDTTEPDVTLTADPVDGENGYYIQDPVNVWLTATDNFSGVDHIYFRVDGGEYQSYVDGIVVSGEADHLVEYYVVDLAGNETAVMQHEVKIDHTVPELIFTHGTVDGKNGYYATVPVVHTLAGTDNLSGVDQLYYQIDDDEYQIYVDGIRINDDGAHVVHYYGKDKAGNETEVFSHSFQVDSTAPSTTVTRIKPVMNELAANIRFAVTDNYSGLETIHYRVNDGLMLTTQYEIYLTTPGKHVVTYYAEDQAGNLEAAEEVWVEVMSLDVVDLVENVELTEFHNALTNEQPFEIDRKIEIGDLIYLDESYTFEELPEYLRDTRLIRTNRHANHVGYHDYYLKFDTTVPVKVYVVVENTVTELAEFTYMGQTKFASRKHFSEMQNVYMRKVSGTTTIRIPGSKLVDLGHAPLVFVDYDDSWTQPYTCIEKVAPVKENGTWYLDLDGYGYDLEDGMLEGIDLSWSYVVDGQETHLADGDTVRLPIIFKEEQYLLEVRLTAMDSDGVTGIASKLLLVVDQSGVFILQPQNQDKFLPGETITLAGEVRDEMGGLLSTPLQWQIQRENGSWQSVGSGNLMEYTLPMEQGAYYVRAYVGDDEMVVKFEVTQTNKKPGKGNGKSK